MPCIAELHEADDLAMLPAEAAALFETDAAAALGESFYTTRAWYDVVLAAACPVGSTPCFVWVTLDGVPSALFPMLCLQGGAMQSLTTPYTCLYQPLLSDGLQPGALAQVAETLGQWCRRRSSLRLEALASDWPGLPTLAAGLQAAGLSVLQFDHFGNRYEPVAGLTWAAYLAERDGALRETIRRRAARAARDPAIRFAWLCSAEEAEAGIAAFETVYAQSWKQPEPYPTFNASLIRMAAAHGVLRLAVMSRQDRPIAVQYWIVTGGCASVQKLAHDTAFRALSPGTVLTAWAIRRLLEQEAITTIDFGRGDDPYKQAWTRHRRQRIGLLAVNPRRFAGLMLLGRHRLGRALRRLQAALRTMVERRPA